MRRSADVIFERDMGVILKGEERLNTTHRLIATPTRSQARTATGIQTLPESHAN